MHHLNWLWVRGLFKCSLCVGFFWRLRLSWHLTLRAKESSRTAGGVKACVLLGLSLQLTPDVVNHRPSDWLTAVKLSAAPGGVPQQHCFTRPLIKHTFHALHSEYWKLPPRGTVLVIGKYTYQKSWPRHFDSVWRRAVQDLRVLYSLVCQFRSPPGPGVCFGTTLLVQVRFPFLKTSSFTTRPAFGFTVELRYSLI